MVLHNRSSYIRVNELECSHSGAKRENRTERIAQEVGKAWLSQDLALATTVWNHLGYLHSAILCVIHHFADYCCFKPPRIPSSQNDDWLAKVWNRQLRHLNLTRHCNKSQRKDFELLYSELLWLQEGYAGALKRVALKRYDREPQ